MMKASVDEVVIVADGQEIARHRRSYEAGDLVSKSPALPGPVGTKGRGPGPGGAIARMGSTDRVRHVAASRSARTISSTAFLTLRDAEPDES